MSERKAMPRMKDAKARLQRMKVSAVVASVVTFAALTAAIADQVESTPIASAAGSSTQVATQRQDDGGDGGGSYYGGDDGGYAPSNPSTNVNPNPNANVAPPQIVSATS